MTRMDADNFIEMSEAAARISLATGRDNNTEWRLASIMPIDEVWINRGMGLTGITGLLLVG